MAVLRRVALWSVDPEVVWIVADATDNAPDDAYRSVPYDRARETLERTTARYDGGCGTRSRRVARSLGAAACGTANTRAYKPSAQHCGRAAPLWRLLASCLDSASHSRVSAW